MLEQLIENGLECLDKAENTSEDWLYDLYIADARKEFRRAVEIAPDEPWLWFQIGWLNLIDDDEIDDPEPIRTALQRALDLDPDLVAAHVALAYVEAKISKAHYFDSEDYSGYLDFILEVADQVELLEQRIAENDEPEIVDAFHAQIDQLRAGLKGATEGVRQRMEQAIWTGPAGEHLRAARERNWHELFEPRDVTIPGTEVVIKYYPCVIDYLRVIDMLDELVEYLPTNERAKFYHLIGMGFCNDSIRPAGATWFEYDIKWFEKAARWADMVTDRWELFNLFTHLSGAYQEMKPPDYPAAFKSVLEGYSHLIHLNNRDDEYGYWLGHIPGPSNWDPGSDWPVVQQVIEAALDQSPFEKSLSATGGRGLAHFAVWGARTAMRGGYKQQALSYLLRAREIDPSSGSVAELLAEIYLDESDLAKALDEYRRVIAVDPAHAQAKRLTPILELAQEGSLNSQARDLILQVLPELRAGQDDILNELSLQRGLMQQMAEAQRIALREVERSRNEDSTERTYDDLLDQLHRLVQEGSRIQPAAWGAARARVAEELGPKVFNGFRSHRR
jgi:tetratricopeptide (TPR) repeat protein